VVGCTHARVYTRARTPERFRSRKSSKAVAAYCTLLHASQHARVCARMHVPCGLACVCVCVCVSLRVPAWMRAGPPACASVCVCVCMRAAVLPRRALLRGTLGLLRWYLRDINGTRRVLGECSMGHSSRFEGYSRRTHTEGTLRNCVRACDPMHLLGLSQEGRTARHGSSRRTGSTGGVLDEYSRRLYVVRSIAAITSVRLRRDELDDVHADARAGYELP
jgi:hypothetical protein